VEEIQVACGLTATAQRRQIREIIQKGPRYGVVTISLRSYFAGNLEYTMPSWVYDYGTEYAKMSQSEAVVESIDRFIAKEFSRDEIPYHTAIIRIFDRRAVNDCLRFLAWVLPLIQGPQHSENAG
jgi:hypothetical protein